MQIKSLLTIGIMSGSLLLTGCASEQQFVTNGTITREKLLARTPGQYKQLTAQGAIAGAAIGAASGALIGGAAVASVGSMAGGLMSAAFPGFGAAMVLSAAIGLGTAGAIAGGVMGSNEHYFEQGFRLYKYQVALEKPQGHYLNFDQFTKMAYPVGLPVSIYASKQNGHITYTAKPLVSQG